ncbi:hypothetical protein [Nonomuraea endophytica]|uniref:hypothetical protein n=1 Tax=Nonomuraea endophytica TaxID=714136 RepID=UPI0037C8FB42
MTSTTEQTRVPLSTDDRARAKRLTEEVKSRLYEVSLIMGRTLDREFPADSLIKYEPKQSTQADDGQTIEVVVIALPDGTFACLQDPPGISIYPC